MNEEEGGGRGTPQVNNETDETHTKKGRSEQRRERKSDFPGVLPK